MHVNRRGGSVFRDEREFVRWLQRQTPRAHPNVRLGIGDDAALVGVAPGHELILTTDLSIEGVHFTRALHPARSVGHRALARSLSDIAAMGGTPRFALVSIALSERTTRAWIQEFYRGIRALARQFSVALIGGDTAVVPGGTTIDVVAVGELERGRALLRSGAHLGDQIFVSGCLGLSALGLRLMKSRPGRAEPARRCAAIKVHLFPEPQCALGRYLSEKRLASALIDISDGLSTDLGHLVEASDVGARLWEELIPRPQVQGSWQLSRADMLQLALHGGEDYQLLFAVPPHKVSLVPRKFRGAPLRRIGEIRVSRGLFLVRADGKEEALRPVGYDHFRNWAARIGSRHAGA